MRIYERNKKLIGEPRYVVTTNRKGHYYSYGALVRAILNDRCVQIVESIGVINSIKAIDLIFIDGDRSHLAYFPVVLIRALLFGRTTSFFSVRTEHLTEKGIYPLVKRILFYILVKTRRVNMISIHKPACDSLIGRYITHTIYDLQLWDLPILSCSPRKPKELEGIESISNALVVIGELNEKRSRREIIEYCQSAQSVPVLFAGGIDQQNYSVLQECDGVRMINRYILDEEIIWLYMNCLAVYAFYDVSVKRPSGILGRAIQMNRLAVVRKNGYLHNNYSKYSGLIAVCNLTELKKHFESNDATPIFDSRMFDDSLILKQILT